MSGDSDSPHESVIRHHPIVFSGAGWQLQCPLSVATVFLEELADLHQIGLALRHGILRVIFSFALAGHQKATLVLQTLMSGDSFYPMS
jgi:hypothetical protein